MTTYKLVPVEPTEEMLAEGVTAALEGISWTTAAWIYEAMLATAPAVQGEPVGWHTEDHLDDKSATTYSAEVAQRRDKGWPVRPLYTAPQPTEQQPAPDVAGLERALKSMVSGYMRLLQSGYDRITDLGGDCDPVDVMERNDACLLEARNALAVYHQQGGEPAGAEQQPGVTLLLELLSHARCNTCDGSGGFYDNHGQPHQCQWCHDRSTALAAYHKQGGES